MSTLKESKFFETSFSLKPPTALPLKPPIITPEPSIISPSRVTILVFPIPKRLAAGIFSTTKVFPKTC